MQSDAERARSMSAATNVSFFEAATPAATATATATSTATASGWQPTHVVPSGGLPAWNEPSPDQPVATTLDGGVELAVAEQRGDWARVSRPTAGRDGWTLGRSSRATGERSRLPLSELAALANALAELTDVVRQQGELLGRIALRLGIEEGEADLHQEAAAARDDVLWQRLGLVEGERRNVTVLFVDVSGFTALSEHLDPEEFQLVMKDTMSAIAARHHALRRLHREVHRRCCVRDLRCADRPRRRAAARGPQRAGDQPRAREQRRPRPDLPPLGMHAGINTGVVIAGTVGDGSQFGVMGDTINTASRLLNLAAQEEIFVSAETARRLRRQFRLEDRGAFEVKGKHIPVAASTSSASSGPVERGDGDRLGAPFVDREAELGAAPSRSARCGTRWRRRSGSRPRRARSRQDPVGGRARARRGRPLPGDPGLGAVVGEQPLGVLIEAVESQLGALPGRPRQGDRHGGTARRRHVAPRLRADPGSRACGRSRRAARCWWCSTTSSPLTEARSN